MKQINYYITCITEHTMIYYIPISDTSFELSVFFWLSDTENWINKLRFSDSISLSFKTRKTLVTFFAATLCNDTSKHGTIDGKCDDVTSRNETYRQTFPQFFLRIKDQKQFIKSV